MSAQLLSVLEWTAAIAGLVNVFLLTRQTVWSWPFGLVSVFLYAFVFYHNRLYSDVLLHIIYVVLNIFGWYKWAHKKNALSDSDLKVSVLGPVQRSTYAIVIVIGFLIWGYLLKRNTNADFAYADAFILMASLCAQYLIAIKKLENWVIWIIVDIVAITIYYLKALYVTSGLYAVYLCLCILGFMKWRKSLLHKII